MKPLSVSVLSLATSACIKYNIQTVSITEKGEANFSLPFFHFGGKDLNYTSLVC